VADLIGMTAGRGEIRTRVFRLLKNSLALGFTLIFINLLRPELTRLINVEIEGFPVTGELISNIISLVLIVYFGYFVLIDSKYFLDFLSSKLERKERGKAKSITYDIAAVISLVLTSLLLTPFVASIPDVGYAVAKVINIVFLAVGFLIVYHLAGEVYYLTKKHIEALIREASRQFRKEGKNETSNGGPK
jgi:predicted PurR-regulated permease PerM